MGEIAILHAEDSRVFSCRIGAELAAEGHSVLRREAGAPVTGSVMDPAARADAVIIVWSPEMITHGGLIDAARRALARRALVPIRIGGVEPPSSFAHLWPIDLDGWNGETEDPRWQFVRDETTLALRRSELTLTPTPLARATPRRRFSETVAEAGILDALFSHVPARLIAPGAAGLAVAASAAVILTAQQSRVDVAAEPPMVAYVEPIDQFEAVQSETANAGQAPAEALVEIPPPPDDLREPAEFTLAALTPEEAASLRADGVPLSVAVAPQVQAGELALDATQSSGSVASESPSTGRLAAGPEPTEVASREAPPAPAASEPALPEPPLDDFTGVVFRDCLDCPDMAEIPAGGEASLASFALSRREVTFEEWRLCVADGGCRGYSPSDREQGRGKRPAVRISYEDARAYVEWLSSKTGRRYRLPTEREWTFAALAGGEGPFPRNFAPSPDLANFAEGPWRKSLPAGSFRPSDYGLFDMQGNVWEWTEDCAGGEGGPCAARVLKGGAFDAPAQSLKASARTARSQSARLSNVGFRVARELP